MSRLPRIKLKHKSRGSWFAVASDTAARNLLGEQILPVLRDWNAGTFIWGPPHPRYVESRGEDTGGGTVWWSEPGHAAWRSSLVDGTIVWVREVRHDGTRAASVGRSKGVWRICSVEIDDERLKLDLIERVAEVRE